MRFKFKVEGQHKDHCATGVSHDPDDFNEALAEAIDEIRDAYLKKPSRPTTPTTKPAAAPTTPATKPETSATKPETSAATTGGAK